MKTRKILSVFLALAMVFGVLPSLTLPAKAAEGDIITEATTAKVGDYTIALPVGAKELGDLSATVPAEVTDSTDKVTWNAGWYVVKGANVTIANTGNHGVDLNGNVNLILLDGAKLTVKGDVKEVGISGSDKTLTVYAGSTTDTVAGTGKLEVKGGYGNTGNGGEGISAAVTVNGGSVTATGGNGVSNDGGSGISGNVTVNGGSVMATGGIGNGNGADGITGNVAVNGGFLIAIGGDVNCEDNGKAIGGSITTVAGLCYKENEEGTAWGAGTTDAKDAATSQSLIVQIAPTVNYLDETGAVKPCSDYIIVTDSTSQVTWGKSGETLTYVVNHDTSISVSSINAVTLNGNVNLILLDGCKLSVKTDGQNKVGVQASGVSALTIFAGSTTDTVAGTGRLDVTGGSDASGGGNGFGVSSLTINGGCITSYAGCAIMTDSSISINGGTVVATGTASALSTYGSFIVNDGIVIGTAAGDTYTVSGNVFVMNGGTVVFENTGSGSVCSFVTSTTVKADATPALNIKAGADAVSATTVANDADLKTNLTGDGKKFVQIAPTVNYLDETGKVAATPCTDYIIVTDSTSNVNWGKNGETITYVVNHDTSISDSSRDPGVSLDGNVNLILLDGAKLDVSSSTSIGIVSPPSATLTVTAGSTGSTVAGTGRLETKGGSFLSMTGMAATNGAVTVNGGSVTAIGGNGTNLGGDGISGAVTVKGGSLTAIGGTGSTNGRAINTARTITVAAAAIVKQGDTSASDAVTHTGSIAGAALTKRFVSIVVPDVPAFDDGFGGKINLDGTGTGYTAYTAFTENSVPTADCHAKTQGYTFAGWWYDKSGTPTKLNTATEDPVAGTTYTAKWTKNGKTVVTEKLYFNNMDTTDKLSDEGWKWDKTNKILTLSGLTLDVVAKDNGEKGAPKLEVLCFSGSMTIQLTENTENTIAVRNRPGELGNCRGITCPKLTVTGSGTLNIDANWVNGANGIYSSALTVSGGAKVTAKTDAKGTPISAEGDILITGEGTSVTTEGCEYGIQSDEGSVTVEKGAAVKVTNQTAEGIGIKAAKSIQIDNASVTVFGAKQALEAGTSITIGDKAKVLAGADKDHTAEVALTAANAAQYKYVSITFGTPVPVLARLNAKDLPEGTKLNLSGKTFEDCTIVKAEKGFYVQNSAGKYAKIGANRAISWIDQADATAFLYNGGLYANVAVGKTGCGGFFRAPRYVRYYLATDHFGKLCASLMYAPALAEYTALVSEPVTLTAERTTTHFMMFSRMAYSFTIGGVENAAKVEYKVGCGWNPGSVFTMNYLPAVMQIRVTAADKTVTVWQAKLVGGVYEMSIIA